MGFFLVLLVLLVCVYGGIIAWFNLKEKCQLFEKRLSGNNSMSSCKLINKAIDRNGGEPVENAKKCEELCTSEEFADTVYDTDTQKCTCMPKCESIRPTGVTPIAGSHSACKVHVGVDWGPGLFNFLNGTAYTPPALRKK